MSYISSSNSLVILVGSRYKFLIDNNGPWPDPASRYQPEGIHGPSQVVAAEDFNWTDAQWNGIDPSVSNRLSIYELHVGTFTTHGTFAALCDKLAYLKELGVTTIEIMPVADFPGKKNNRHLHHNWLYQ